MLCTIRAEFRWMAFRDCAWVVVRLASQTVQAYSRVGLSSCLCALSRRWGSVGGIVLLMQPSLLEALEFMYEVFSFHRRDPPASLPSIWLMKILAWWCHEVCRCYQSPSLSPISPTRRGLVTVVVGYPQYCRWRCHLQITVLLIWQRWEVVDIWYMRKRTGPTNDPWGTPEETAHDVEEWPSNTTDDWDLLFRKFRTQSTIWLLTPIWLSLGTNLWWSSLSSGTPYPGK